MRVEHTWAIILMTAIFFGLIAALPRWPYSRSWGYRPSAVLTAVRVAVVFLRVTGRC